MERLLKYDLCKQVSEASKDDLFTALALAVREIATDQMFETAARYSKVGIYFFGRSERFFG